MAYNSVLPVERSADQAIRERNAARASWLDTTNPNDRITRWLAYIWAVDRARVALEREYASRRLS